MTVYNYSREIGADGRYNVDNFERVDGETNPILLATEIETNIPSKIFKLECNGTDVNVDFPSYTLTTGEETTLTNTINDHKNNT